MMAAMKGGGAMGEKETAVAKTPPSADGEDQGAFRLRWREDPCGGVGGHAAAHDPKRMLALVYAAATKTPALRLHDREPRHVPDDLRRAGAGARIAGHVYLIPAAQKIRGRRESRPLGDRCTLLVGYKGTASSRGAPGEIASIDAVPVYEGEPFKVRRGTDPGSITSGAGTWTARQSWWLSTPSPGCATAPSPEVLTRQEIDARRNRSQSSGSGPWVTDYARMARKTGLRLLFAGGLVPLSAEIVRAIEADDEGEDYIDVAGRRTTRPASGPWTVCGVSSSAPRSPAMTEADPRAQLPDIASCPRPPGPVHGAVQRWRDRQGDGRLARGRCS